MRRHQISSRQPGIFIVPIHCVVPSAHDCPHVDEQCSAASQTLSSSGDFTLVIDSRPDQTANQYANRSISRTSFRSFVQKMSLLFLHAVWGFYDLSQTCCILTTRLETTSSSL